MKIQIYTKNGNFEIEEAEFGLAGIRDSVTGVLVIKPLGATRNIAMFKEWDRIAVDGVLKEIKNGKVRKA
jgi:hypothetical protein